MARSPSVSFRERSLRMRLGLVLSGGGARGAAHVGVLKVLEEIHVPVDVIAGASMGSIVGGLYATGMSPQEMEDALATMDWDGSFEDKEPRVDRPFRRKFDESSFLTKLTFGIDKGRLAFPTGLVQGQRLNFILRQLTLPSALVDDFDKLNIPFRAIATDVASGGKVLLTKGNIAEAMRASMAFPGLFAPVEMDNRLLVDGGVVENFPVVTARKAGAEVLIAVNIGTPPAKKEELNSVLKIVNQVTSAATDRNVAESKAAIGPKDVFIEPDLGDISFIAFTRVRDAVACGERSAREQIEELKRFSVPEAEYRAWRERTRRKPYTPYQIAAVELVNPSPVPDERLNVAGLGAFTTGKYTLQVFAQGGSPVGTDLPYYDYFQLGGFRRLSGYGLDTLAGPYMAFGSLTLLREVGRLPSLVGGGIFLGLSLETGNTWGLGSDVKTSNLLYAGALFLGAETPLGPVYLGYGLGEGGHSALLFQIGVPF